MALKFKCSHCGQDIIVKHLTVGEEAMCWNCGLLTAVPMDSEETDEIPSFKNPATAYQIARVKLYDQPKRNIFKPTGKQILLAIIITAMISVATQTGGDEPDSFIKHVLKIIGIFIISYMISFLPSYSAKPEKEIEKFSPGTARRESKCANCRKDILKGEPIFLKPDFIARLFKEEIILCIGCYNDFKLSLMNPKK